MTVIFPDPLPGGIAAYHSELARLEAEIAAAEKQLAQLRRERGCRLLQLAELTSKDPEQA